MGLAWRAKAADLLFKIAVQIKEADLRNEVYVMPLETQKEVTEAALEARTR